MTSRASAEFERSCRRALAEIQHYRHEVEWRRAAGGYDLEALQWVETYCDNCTEALNQGDVAMLLVWHASLIKHLVWARNPIIEGHARSAVGRSGGNGRAASLAKDPDRHAWMVPLFDAAYASLDAECRARIGHGTLLWMALREAGPTHKRRDELTEYHARLYLKNRRKPAP